jgi:diadenosine tetraphosphate (Ap4A) HIT family hydrolase
MNTLPVDQNECPLCPENNLLKEPIIAQTPDAYLIKAYNLIGNYLIVPVIHTESPETLPSNWWQSVTTLLPHIPLGQSYNISINMGADAGQSIKHIHFWVIPREAGQPASGKGFARLINEANASTS